jgi:aryl-alcohol dehydrogenase-like predicted oxidoreductase
LGRLGGGYFKTAAQRQKAEDRQMPGAIEQTSSKISEVLEKIAARHDSIITSIALAYVMHKTPYIFPIIGGRNLQENIQALNIRFSTDDISEI